MMAVAARQGQLGLVFLHGRRLQYWESTRGYADSPELASVYATNMISEYSPDVFVTEDPTFATMKKKHTKELLRSLADTARADMVRVVALKREQRYQNKIEEAKAIAERFPVLAEYVPDKPFYEKEARRLVLFEAMALALDAHATLLEQVT